MKNYPGDAKKNQYSQMLVEALIGAIYIDSGIKFVKSWLIQIYENRIENMINTPNITDYKTYLQEAVQADFSKLVKYKLTGTEGPDHDKIFHSVVLLDRKILGRGTGTSKKESEQNAAKNSLISLYNLDLK